GSWGCNVYPNVADAAGGDEQTPGFSLSEMDLEYLMHNMGFIPRFLLFLFRALISRP
ncbi:hypothetical protein ASPCADRAFT_210584, partial [Aspergillus carbonarius ITEM 5010]